AARVARWNDVARCRKVTAEAAGKRYAKTSTAGSGAGRHEKSLSRKLSACGDDRSACKGGGLAVQGATTASGGVLRLVPALTSASTSAGRTITSLTISRRRAPSLPTSRPATTTPSSESTPARNGSGARGFSPRKRRAADAPTNVAARAASCRS